jgi:hypothetical protein
MKLSNSTFSILIATTIFWTPAVGAQEDRHRYVGDFGWHKVDRRATQTTVSGPVETKFREAPIPKEIQMQLFNFKEALARSKADPKAQVTILGKLSCSKSKLYLQPVLPTGKATNDRRVRIVPKKTLYDQKVLTNKTVVVNGNFDKGNNFHADSVVEWKGLFQTK